MCRPYVTRKYPEEIIGTEATESVMEKPLISVIVPIYNALPYLESSMGSLCTQSYENLEIIAVDDGSSDDSFKVLKEMALQDKRIRVFAQENSGSSSARNVGLRAATGEYIGFMDASDYIEKDMYENLLNALEKDSSADVSQILSCEEDEDGNLIKTFDEGFNNSQSVSGKEFIKTLLLNTGDSSFCTKLFRRRVFEGFYFSEEYINKDFALLVKMSEKIKNLKVIPKPGYHIILRDQGNTKDIYNHSFYEDAMDNARMMLALTARKYPDLYQDAIHFFCIQAMWFLLHIPASEMRDNNELYMRTMDYIRGLRRFILTDKYMPIKYKRNLLVFACLPAKKVKILYEKMNRWETMLSSVIKLH